MWEEEFNWFQYLWKFLISDGGAPLWRLYQQGGKTAWTSQVSSPPSLKPNNKAATKVMSKVIIVFCQHLMEPYLSMYLLERTLSLDNIQQPSSLVPFYKILRSPSCSLETVSHWDIIPPLLDMAFPQLLLCLDATEANKLDFVLLSQQPFTENHTQNIFCWLQGICFSSCDKWCFSMWHLEYCFIVPEQKSCTTVHTGRQLGFLSQNAAQPSRKSTFPKIHSWSLANEVVYEIGACSSFDDHL